MSNSIQSFNSHLFLLVDTVEFTPSSDYRTNKPVAIQVKIAPLVALEGLGDQPLTGKIECEARPGSPASLGDEVLGRVSYDRNGVSECPLF